MKCNISKKMRKIPQNTEGVFTACLALNTPSLLLLCFLRFIFKAFHKDLHLFFGQ